MQLNLGILLTLTEHFAPFRATFTLQKLQKSQQCFQKFFIGIQNVFSRLHTVEHYRIAFLFLEYVTYLWFRKKWHFWCLVAPTVYIYQMPFHKDWKSRSK